MASNWLKASVASFTELEAEASEVDGGTAAVTYALCVLCEECFAHTNGDSPVGIHCWCGEGDHCRMR